MNSITKYFRGYRLVTTLLLLLVYTGASMCNTTSNKPEVKKIYGPNDAYIGSHSCITCHKEIYDNYIKAAPHYKTSAMMGPEKLLQALPNSDTTFYSNKLFVTVHKTNGSIYQTAYSNGIVAASHSMDMVIGSGRKGQTFLFWNDSSLYQLPLSYSFAYGRWINSPGYPVDKAIFNRTIPVKCFECHSSYAEQNFNEVSTPIFDSSRMVLGISCETCHGPGKKHVRYHLEKPADKTPAFIINTSGLTRQQQLDACAGCHSGIRENIKPAFSFLPGNKLDEFFKPAYHKDSTAALDVHGNQYGLLIASKCFKQSTLLNCSSCHNVHLKESNSKEIFSQRCMSCHKESNNNFCRVKNIENPVLIANCIDCHMPLQASGQITFNTGKEKQMLYDSIRTHLIGIYKESGKLYLKKK